MSLDMNVMVPYVPSAHDSDWTRRFLEFSFKNVIEIRYLRLLITIKTSATVPYVRGAQEVLLNFFIPRKIRKISHFDF